jgi:nucleoid-associated protein YgaU
MKRNFFKGIAAVSFLSIIFAIGCARVKTYTVVKDRVDQSATGGNQGYFSGADKEIAAPPNRRLTRKTYVAEVEFGRSDRPRKGRASQPPVKEAVSEPVRESAQEAVEVAQVPQTTPQVASYVVQANDTLQKISLNVYGTSKKWKKIFEANSDKLKTPDKIYAGQELKIP